MNVKAFISRTAPKQFLNALLLHSLHLQKGYQNVRHSLVTMEERVWKMIMTKKDSSALALKNIKGNIVKVPKRNSYDGDSNPMKG